MKDEEIESIVGKFVIELAWVLSLVCLPIASVVGLLTVGYSFMGLKMMLEQGVIHAPLVLGIGWATLSTGYFVFFGNLIMGRLLNKA